MTVPDKVLLDTLVFMYAIGRPHEHKAACVKLVQLVAEGLLPAAIDSEVLQEILYRYWHLGLWSDMEGCFELAYLSVPETLSVESEDAYKAKDFLVANQKALSPRDAIHAAVALRTGLTLCSYDEGLDLVPGIERITPEDLVKLIGRHKS